MAASPPSAPPSRARTTARLCVQNARRQLRAADLLFQAGDHGSAAFHLVTCKEELAKALAYLLVDLDVGRIEVQGKNRTLVVLPGTLDLQFNLNRHDERGATIDSVDSILALTESAIGMMTFLAGLLSVGDPSSADRVNELLNSDPAPVGDSEAFRLAVDRAKMAAVLDARMDAALRERGTYVDDPESGDPSVPWSVTEQEVRELRGRVEADLVRLGPYVMEDTLEVMQRRGILRLLVLAKDSSNGNDGA